MSAMLLASALFTRTQEGVFRELYKHPEGVHLRELERTTGVNGRHLLRELHSLRDAGVLVSKKVGNALVYQFNSECPIHEDLQAIIRKTVGLGDVVREMLDPYMDQIDSAYIFGSHAGGEQRADSDIDLMIVGQVTRRQLSSAIRKHQETLGREINTVIYTRDEYDSQLNDNNSFAARVHRGSRINLV